MKTVCLKIKRHLCRVDITSDTLINLYAQTEILNNMASLIIHTDTPES